MKIKNLFLLASLAMVMPTTAQTPQEDFKRDITLSGSNYVAYRGPQKELTPAPKGYKPFYLSHYGRHGSRYMIGKEAYDVPYFALLKAKQEGKLTAKGEEIDRILGLELGADDYIVKPFSPREVVARIKAVLRRTSEQQSNDDGRVTLNGLVIDIKSYTVTLKGQPVICTPKEIEILYMLASNPGQVFTREQLLNKVWGYDFAGETRTVDTHIKRIRAKLDNTGLNWSIKTIYGVGYKFEVE